MTLFCGLLEHDGLKEGLIRTFLAVSRENCREWYKTSSLVSRKRILVGIIENELLYKTPDAKK